ncbi:phage Gp37/Gp68 family protein [Streptomyces brasiliscabiei]|uniref:Phage Gp37/Gp68 family protein n=1 Tax=Streptomyces brasiliscabiei TaxID=2736302 RepID=A0ABU8G9Y0_9ACTN
MATTTSIEWTRGPDGSPGKTWNPIIGCDRVSPGCDHCYAISTARIREGNPNPKISAAFAGTAERTEGGVDWTGKVNLLDDRLTQPLRWKKPARVFVNSLSDLFHDAVPDEFIAQVFAVMAATPQHTYQVLTKRHGRMRSLLNRPSFRDNLAHLAAWPLPNVWLGCSVENQQWADLRIPALLDTPAAVRFLSCEPLLGPVDLRAKGCPEAVWDGPYRMRCGLGGDGEECSRHGEFSRLLPDGLHWLIVGGESGPQARPMHPDWARSVRDQCEASGTAFFLKQHGEWQPLGPLYGDLEDTDEGHMEAVHLDVVEGKRVIQLESSGYIAEGHQPGDSRTWLMARVGKKAAGRELDGRTHDDFPEPPGSDFQVSVEAGLTEDLAAFSRRLDAATTKPEEGEHA